MTLRSVWCAGVVLGADVFGEYVIEIVSGSLLIVIAPLKLLSAHVGRLVQLFTGGR